MSTHDTDSQDSIDHTDPETLRGLYWGEGKTISEIADVADTTPGSVGYHMRKHGIKRRGRGEANRVEYATYYTRKDGYEVWDIQSGTVPIHRLLAVSVYGYDAVCGSDIHHNIPIEWLNTPGNVKPVSREDHLHEHSQFDESDIREMRRLKRETDMYDREIAERFDTSRSTVNTIVRGCTWSDVK